MLIDPKVIQRRYIGIEQAPLKQVNAIVVHQTDSSSEFSAFNKYAKSWAAWAPID
jgi:hypothetical protein